MGSSNPREVFASTFVKKIFECQNMSALVVARCDKGKTLRPFSQTIDDGLFNDMSKNFSFIVNMDYNNVIFILLYDSILLCC